MDVNSRHIDLFKNLLGKAAFVAFLVAAAYFSELYRMQPSFGSAVTYWDIFILTAAAFLGPIFGALTGFSSGVLILYGDYTPDLLGWPDVIRMTAEGLFVGALHFKPKPLSIVVAASLFWVVLGIPSSMFLYRSLLDQSLIAFTMEVFRYTASGIGAALVVQLLCVNQFTRRAFDVFGYRQAHRTDEDWNWAAVVNTYIAALVLLPVLVILQYSATVSDEGLRQIVRGTAKTKSVAASAVFGSVLESAENRLLSLSNVYRLDGIGMARQHIKQYVSSRDYTVGFWISDRRDAQNVKQYRFPADLPEQPEYHEGARFSRNSLGTTSVASLNDTIRIAIENQGLTISAILQPARFPGLEAFLTDSNALTTLAIATTRGDQLVTLGTPLLFSGQRPSEYWESLPPGFSERSSTAGAKLQSRVNSAAAIGGYDDLVLIRSFSLKAITEQSLQGWLVLATGLFVYVMCMMLIMFVATSASLAQFSALVRSAEVWRPDKPALLSAEVKSNVKEINALATNLKLWMQSQIDERAKLQRAERTNREHADYVGSIFQSVQSPLFVFDAEGALTLWNLAAQDNVAKPLEGISVKALFEWVSPARYQQLQDAFAKAMLGESTRGLEITSESGGQRMVMLASMFPLRILDSVEGVVVFAQDITENLETYESLVQSSKLADLGKLSTVIAHEVNQPLNIIRLAAENLQLSQERGLLQGCQVESKAGRIIEQVDRAADIVARLRVIGRKPSIDMGPVDVIDCLHRTVLLMQGQLMLDGVSLEFEVGDQTATVYGEQIRLEQVFMNIIANARDALVTEQAEDAVVHVKAELFGDTVEIEFCDNAGGIKPNDLSVLFEPFFTSKPIGEGTGIGLSISKKLVESMQGSITAVNAGDGALFTISLPLYAGESS